jgi:hypothetical protein
MLRIKLKFSRQVLKQQDGLTMPEMMIAVGMLAFLAMVMSRLSLDSFQTLKEFQDGGKQISLKMRLASVFLDDELCTHNLQSIVYGAGDLESDSGQELTQVVPLNSTKPILSINTPLNDGTNSDLTSIQLGARDLAGNQVPAIKVNVLQTNPKSGNSKTLSYYFNIKLTFQDDGQTIESCEGIPMVDLESLINQAVANLCPTGALITLEQVAGAANCTYTRVNMPCLYHQVMIGFDENAFPVCIDFADNGMYQHAGPTAIRCANTAVPGGFINDFDGADANGDSDFIVCQDPAVASIAEQDGQVFDHAMATKAISQILAEDVNLSTAPNPCPDGSILVRKHMSGMHCTSISCPNPDEQFLGFDLNGNARCDGGVLRDTIKDICNADATADFDAASTNYAGLTIRQICDGNF